MAIANLQCAIGTTRGYWHYLATAWKYKLPHASSALADAARFVSEEALDLVALCEVEQASRRSRGLDQGAWLAETSGLAHRLFFPTVGERPHRHQGNALCSRFPLEPVANHRLPGGGEPRYLAEARWRIDGGPVRVFVTHLSLERRDRPAQIDRIAEIVGEGDSPVLLAGDFNVSREEELELLVDSALNKSLSAPTFPSWRPSRHLDHLFFSEHFEFRSQQTFQRFRFSDHLPLVAEVCFRGGVAGSR